MSTRTSTARPRPAGTRETLYWRSSSCSTDTTCTPGASPNPAGALAACAPPGATRPSPAIDAATTATIQRRVTPVPWLRARPEHVPIYVVIRRRGTATLQRRLAGPAVSAAARRQHTDHVARAELDRALVAEALGVRLLAGAQQPVLARCPRFAAVEAPRSAGAALGHQRDGGVLEHLQVALDALTAGVLAASPAVTAEAVAQDPHREDALERLDRRVLGVGHRRVHAAHPRPARPPALAAGQRLVVHPPFAADEDVVHRPLTGRADAPGQGLGEHAEAAVGHPLAHLHVAGAHGDRRTGAHDRTRGRHDVHRAQGTAVGRNRGIGGGSDGEGDSAHGHGLDSIDIPRPLLVAAGEVERGGVAVDDEGDDDPRRPLLVGTRTGGIEDVLKGPLAVRDIREGSAHPALAVVGDL